MGLVFVACLLLASAVAEADTVLGAFSGANGGRSATASFSLSASGDKLTIDLENTTAAGLTKDATYLLTGLSFSFSGGGAPTLSYLSGDALGADGYEYIDVATNGTITANTVHTSMDWSLDAIAGDPFVKFNPDSNKSIIGYPDGGDYSEANDSIAGNPAHNPFTYRKGRIVLGVEGWSSGLQITGANFFFGTDYAFQTVPLPAPAILGFGLLAGIGLVAKIRQRRRRGI